MAAMIRRNPALFWLLVGVLLLKAAAPLLAIAAAQRQGVALVEVCSVYGVRSVVADGSPASPPDHQHASEAGHCTLAATLGPWLPSGTVDEPQAGAARPPAPCDAVSHAAPPADACRRWLAGQLHAPPARA